MYLDCKLTDLQDLWSSNIFLMKINMLRLEFEPHSGTNLYGAAMMTKLPVADYKMLSDSEVAKFDVLQTGSYFMANSSFFRPSDGIAPHRLA